MKKYAIITASISFGLFLLSFITPFCDLYADTVYGLISDVWGVVTSLFAINIGECLMYLAALALLIALVLPVILVFFTTVSLLK